MKGPALCISAVAARYAKVGAHGRQRTCGCLCGLGGAGGRPVVLDETDNRFRCQTCARHGNIVDLVMLAANCDSRRALAALGVGPDACAPETYPRRPVDPVTRACIGVAAAHYHATLLGGSSALKHLQAHGIERETAIALKLGYADGSLLDALAANGIDRCLAGRAGLYGGRGERLIGRLTAPVLDSHGAAGLVGRALCRHRQTEYLSLLGNATHKLPVCHGQPRAGAIVVRGLLDLAALTQWGFGACYKLIALAGTGNARGFDELLALPNGAPVYIAFAQHQAGRCAATTLVGRLERRARRAHVLGWSDTPGCVDLLGQGEAGRRAFAGALEQRTGG